MRHRLPYALFGLLATLVGMATGHLVASLMKASASPVLAVGSTVIDNTPVSLKDFAIEKFGSNDKIVLVGSVVIVVLIAAAIAGIVAQISLRIGAGILLLLVAVATLAALLRPNAGVLDAVPGIVTAITGVATLYWLDRAYRTGALLKETPTEPETTSASTGSTAAVTGTEDEGVPTQSAGSTRRTVLVASAIAVAVAAAMGGAGKLITNLKSRAEDINLPAAADPLPALPAGLETMVPGITPFVVSNADFYRVDTRLDVPNVSTDGWKLTIDGMVDKEVSFTYDDILKMPLQEYDITLTCVSNSVNGKYVGGARWLGVPLKSLLDEAGIDGTKADQLMATDFDGMKIGSPLELVMDGRDAILAVGMNGEQLPREHGFPARVVIPGLYGFISATKWVERLTLTTYAKDQSYWTKRDWATDAPIRISSRIDTPKALETIKAGDTFIGGVAWAQQNGGVAKVQVQLDGGPWQDAMLGPSGGNDYWRQWYLPFTAESGQHRVMSRVVDGNGNMQDTMRREPFPSGSSGIAEIIFNVS